MHKPESVPENKTDHPIQAMRLDLVFINEKKITFNVEDFAIPKNYGLKI